MKCNVVRDLLPLYFDGMCSEETGMQLEEHLETCASCRQMKLELEKEQDWMEEKEDWDKEISPLKRVNKKLRKKNLMIAVCVSLFIMLLTITVFLTHGQVTKSGVSFEMLFEMGRMQRIGKEFAAGNIAPLYEVLDNGYAFQNEESSVLRLVYATLEEYDADMQNAIGEKYTQYFAGKSLRFEGIESIEYTQTAVMGWNNALCVSLKFTAEDNMEYYITLYKMVDGRFLVEDYFGTPYIVYEGGGKDEATSNALGEAYHTEDTLFACLPNKLRDFDLAFMRHAILLSGQRILDGDTSLNAGELLCASMLSKQDLQDGTELMKEELDLLLAQRAQAGDFLTDVIWDVMEYEKSVHLYRYQMRLIFTDIDTLEEEIIVWDVYRVGNKFVYIGDI